MDMRSAAAGILFYLIWKQVLMFIIAFFDGRDGVPIGRGKCYMLAYTLGMKFKLKIELRKMLKEKNDKSNS